VWPKPRGCWASPMLGRYGALWKLRVKEALLFEKSSKNFCVSVAAWSTTAVQKFFGSFS
jgi:hypothetical protein